jgi:hypothetical protein
LEIVEEYKTILKKMKLLNALTLAIVLASLTPFAQTTQDNYFLKKDGTKVKMKPNPERKRYSAGKAIFDSDYSLGGQFLYYIDENDKAQKIAHTKITEMFFNQEHYISKGIKGDKGMLRLHKVIAKSDKYLLTQYFWDGKYYAYVFDNKTNICTDRKIRTGWSKKDDRKFLNSTIKIKFKDCKDFIKQLEENVSGDEIYSKLMFKYGQQNFFFFKISNYEC